MSLAELHASRLPEQRKRFHCVAKGVTKRMAMLLACEVSAIQHLLGPAYMKTNVAR